MPPITHALAERQERASKRRTTALAASDSPRVSQPGAASAQAGTRASASSAAGSHSSSPTLASTRPTRPKRASGGGNAFAIKSLEGPQTGALFAEYFGGALIIVLPLFTQGASKGYLSSISTVMMRLTALTAVFFVLFLMQGSKRGAQAAVWLGLLIDMGIILNAARSQTFSTTADIISNKGTGIQLLASGETVGGGAGSGLAVPPAPPGVTLPNE